MVDTDELCVNTLRFLAVDAVEKAKSGHPGLPLGAAPMAYVLWDRFLRHHPTNPSWWNRDRFVLSAGHGSALLYALLHSTGYRLSISDLQQFRQWGSLTPGHPEHGLTAGVEATTGPLGQGFAMGVGMAIAERHLASRFNRPGFPVIDHRTYAIVSDGDLMEGIASEAGSLAGHLGLGKLLCLYDNNHISLEGPTTLAFSESVPDRFRAYGWHVEVVDDGNDLAAIDRAIRAGEAVTDRPSLISLRTHIGYGSPRQDTHLAHGEPLGPEGTRATKQKLGWPLEPAFFEPEEAKAHFLRAKERGEKWVQEWNGLFQRYRAAEPALAKELERLFQSQRPVGWEADLPVFRPEGGAIATRDASNQVLNALAPRLPELLGGSGDLSPSTKTLLDGTGDFERGTDAGRNVHFGVREHAMVAILNGMALHGGTLPYGATFLVFSDYARGAIRLSALMQTHIVMVFTHDSVAVGEDGPTHEPIEQVLSLRAIPGLRVFRPADANETQIAWRLAVAHPGPTALILTRQKLPVLASTLRSPEEGVARGAYLISPARGGPPEVVLVSTGSEVHLALAAQLKLDAEGTRVSVVSMPSWELFDAQPVEYRNSVLPPDTPKISIEAGVTIGWARYVGASGASLGIDRFGASAPGPVVQERLGLTVDRVLSLVRSVQGSRKGAPAA